MNSPRRWARGASLIEVMVALAMAALLLTSLLEIIVGAERIGSSLRARAGMSNSGAVVAQLLRQDLSQAGLGVPKGLNATTNSNGFYAAVLVASPDQVGILADLPRPDGNFNTFGLLDDHVPTSLNDRHIAWHTENNGGCMPSSTGGCSTANASLFFPGEAGCAAVGAIGDRTCPWGLKRLRSAEPFQVVGANGQWFGATNNTTMTIDDVGQGFMIMLDTGNSFPAGWANNSASSLPTAGASQGWVTTLDRVFFRYVAADRTIERIQCWGMPNVVSVDWPLATATTAPATPCSAPFQGMSAWEVVAQDVDSVVFTYFDQAGTQLTGIDTANEKRSVRRIEWNIAFEKTVADRPTRQEIVGGLFLGMAI